MKRTSLTLLLLLCALSSRCVTVPEGYNALVAGGLGAERLTLGVAPIDTVPEGTAHSPTVLTLEECVDMALMQNKQVAASAMQTQSALFMSKSMKANLFPNLSVQGNALYSTADGSFSIAGGNLPVFLAGGTDPSGYAYFPGATIDYKIGAVFMAGVQLEQPIYTGGRLKTALRMQNIGVQMSQMNERLTSLDVMLQTIRAYANVIKAREMLAVARKYNEVLTTLLRDVENAKSHGLTAKNDVLKVQVKLNESELGIRRAENALRLASMNLCHLIGLPLLTPIVVPDGFGVVPPALTSGCPSSVGNDCWRNLTHGYAYSVPSALDTPTEPARYVTDTVPEGYCAGVAEGLRSEAELPSGKATPLNSVPLGTEHFSSITSRPEYELLETQVAMAEQEVRLQQGDKLPQIGVAGNYSYMNGMKISGDRVLDNGYFSVLLNVSIPLYHFGECTNRVKAAKAKLVQTQLQREDLDEALLLELSLSENNLDEAVLETELTERSLTQAAENMRVSRSQYDAGLETLSDHLEAQALWQQAYGTYVEAQCNQYLAYVEYLKASGLLSVP